MHSSLRSAGAAAAAAAAAVGIVIEAGIGTVIVAVRGMGTVATAVMAAIAAAAAALWATGELKLDKLSGASVSTYLLNSGSLTFIINHKILLTRLSTTRE